MQEHPDRRNRHNRPRLITKNPVHLMVKPRRLILQQKAVLNLQQQHIPLEPNPRLLLKKHLYKKIFHKDPLPPLPLQPMLNNPLPQENLLPNILKTISQ